jgi:hypothetical protein
VSEFRSELHGGNEGELYLLHAVVILNFVHVLPATLRIFLIRKVDIKNSGLWLWSLCKYKSVNGEFNYGGSM